MLANAKMMELQSMKVAGLQDRIKKNATLNDVFNVVFFLIICEGKQVELMLLS